MILCGIGAQIFDFFYSIKNRRKNLDLTGNPWHGRTLEWSTSSPPPEYNFAIIPTVDQRDPLWDEKRAEQKINYEDIVLPKNTSMGFVIGWLSLLFGFGMIWEIYWLAGISLIGVIVCMIIRLSGHDEHIVITKEEVRNIEEAFLKNRGAG
jgi:cytochrome o ubiquinol oxidase subunit I